MELFENEFITLKVNALQGHEIHFKVKKTTEMRKVKKSYGERMMVPFENLRYFFNGKFVTDYDTPSTLKMAQNDMIVVMEKGLSHHCELCDRRVERSASLRLHYAQEHYYPEGSFNEFMPQGGGDGGDVLRF